MRLLIGWLIASALGLLLWQPFGRAAKRGDEDALPQSDVYRAILLIACRGYGASHIALSGMRLIKTMMSLGRAAGFAAKQYVESGLRDFRDVDVAQVQSDAGIGELLEYLEQNVYPLYEETT